MPGTAAGGTAVASTAVEGTTVVPAAAEGTAVASGTVELLTGQGWFAVCAAGRLEAGRGVAVLLPDGGQAALFRDRTGALYAIGNVDPFTGAGVLCHGLLGTAGGRPYVASPLLKQRFDLADGRCLDDDEATVAAFAVRVV
ncbi:nitrite reductase small subunit NirD [Streptomyces sp. KK5PA1]|uniref:Nitrite reductase small subunit NirD n=1 Tax=Actinacidiphila acididurans TaxID=2784346 RepID=A0ABS2U2V5_9ACTN|nr:nitrite reductase small subunit NirD [Actinacidiphila acididurans]